MFNLRRLVSSTDAKIGQIKVCLTFQSGSKICVKATPDDLIGSVVAPQFSSGDSACDKVIRVFHKGLQLDLYQTFRSYDMLVGDVSLFVSWTSGCSNKNLKFAADVHAVFSLGASAKPGSTWFESKAEKIADYLREVPDAMEMTAANNVLTNGAAAGGPKPKEWSFVIVQMLCSDRPKTVKSTLVHLLQVLSSFKERGVNGSFLLHLREYQVHIALLKLASNGEIALRFLNELDANNTSINDDAAVPVNNENIPPAAAPNTQPPYSSNRAYNSILVSTMPPSSPSSTTTMVSPPPQLVPSASASASSSSSLSASNGRRRWSQWSVPVLAQNVLRSLRMLDGAFVNLLVEYLDTKIVSLIPASTTEKPAKDVCVYIDDADVASLCAMTKLLSPFDAHFSSRCADVGLHNKLLQLLASLDFIVQTTTATQLGSFLCALAGSTTSGWPRESPKSENVCTLLRWIQSCNSDENQDSLRRLCVSLLENLSTTHPETVMSCISSMIGDHLCNSSCVLSEVFTCVLFESSNEGSKSSKHTALKAEPMPLRRLISCLNRLKLSLPWSCEESWNFGPEIKEYIAALEAALMGMEKLDALQKKFGKMESLLNFGRVLRSIPVYLECGWLMVEALEHNTGNDYTTMLLRHKDILNSLALDDISLLDAGGPLSFLEEVAGVLNLQTKMLLLHYRLRHHGPTCEYILELEVRRTSVVEDTFQLLNAYTSWELRSSCVRVRYLGEEGVGPGILRDWFQCIAKVAFAPAFGLFQHSEKGPLQISPEGVFKPNYLQWYRFCGRIIGMSVAHECILAVRMALSLTCSLLGKEVSLEHLEETDSSLAKGLRWILDNSVEDLNLTFVYTKSEGQNREDIDLIEDGSITAVTESNKDMYVKEVVRYISESKFQLQLAQFTSGFRELLSPYTWELLDPYELQMLVGGQPIIEAEEWKTCVEYLDWSEASPQIAWFWEMVGEKNMEWKHRLFRFITSLENLPACGFKHLPQPMQIVRSTKDHHSLPVAHTCFFQLVFPAYPSKKIMEEKFEIALCECNTFTLD